MFDTARSMLQVRVVAGTLVAIFVLLQNADANACWFRHCRCHHSQRTSYSPGAAPAQQAATKQNTVQMAPYVVAYTPVMYAAPATQQQGLLSSISDIRELLKLAGEIGGTVREIRNDGGLLGRGDSGSQSSSSIEDSLKRLEAGQTLIREDIVNVAGISQQIGEKVVSIKKRLESLSLAPTATEDSEDDEASRPVTQADLKAAIRDALADQGATDNQERSNETVEKRLGELEAKVDKITSDNGTLLAEVRAMMTKMDERLKQVGETTSEPTPETTPPSPGTK